MWTREWTLFLISKETGKEMPHWSSHNRKGCRDELKSLRAQCGGKLPKFLKASIRKTRDYGPKKAPEPKKLHYTGPSYGASGYAFGGPVI